MKIALFGGTFDPPHLGHRFISTAAVAACGLEKVIFLPCHQSPHKTTAPHAAGHHRLAMLTLATKDLAWANVSDWELQRPQPSLSWETTEHFAAVHPQAKLHWIMGVDQWRVLHKWSRPERLAEMLTFIVFPRNGIHPEARPNFRSLFLTDEIEASATAIRNCIAHGKAPGVPLDASVAQYIKRHKLYKDDVKGGGA